MTVGQDFVIGMGDRVGPDAAGGAVVRELGSILIAQAGSARRWRDLSPVVIARFNVLLLRLPGGRRAADERERPQPEALLVDFARTSETEVDAASVPMTAENAAGVLLVLPRRLFPMALPQGAGVRRVSRTPALQAACRLAEALVSPDLPLTEVQAGLAGKALCELLIAALTPPSVREAGFGDRRKASLLDRLLEHVDANLADDMDAIGLCEALRCSRSALYRATSPVGGVSSLINERRLAAVRSRLHNRDEPRTVAELALAHGFPDAASFSRSFKKRYGATATDMRRNSRAEAMRDRSA